MEQCGDQLHLHPLSQGKLPHHHAQFFPDVKQLGQFIDGLLGLDPVQSVNHPVQFQRFGGREIPPKLILLAEHERELPLEIVLTQPRGVAQDRGLAARGIKEPGEHLQGSRLAGTIRAQKADEFAFCHGEADLLRCRGFLVLAFTQSLQRAPKSGLLLVGAIDFGELVNVNGRLHDGTEIMA